MTDSDESKASARSVKWPMGEFIPRTKQMGGKCSKANRKRAGGQVGKVAHDRRCIRKRRKLQAHTALRREGERQRDQGQVDIVIIPQNWAICATP